MGVGLFAEFVLPRGPLHHVVAPVEYPGQFAGAELRAVHAVILAAPLSVVVGAGIGFVWLWVMGRKCSGAAPLAIRATTVTSTPLSAPSATSTPASSPPLGLSLAGRLPLSLGVGLAVVLGSNGPSGTPPGIPLGLDLVRVHERDFLHPVGGVPLHDVVDEVAHQGCPLETFELVAEPECRVEPGLDHHEAVVPWADHLGHPHEFAEGVP